MNNKVHGNFGKRRSEEFKKKLSKIHKSITNKGRFEKGRVITEAERLRISSMNKGRVGYWKGKKRGHYSEELRKK